MKRLIAIIIFICTITACAACQPTPEKSVVQSKNDGVLEQKLGDKETDVLLNVPKHVSETYNAKTPGVNIEIDAAPEYPEDMTRFPVQELSSKEVSTDFIKTAISASLGDNQIYEPQFQRTKSDIAERMHELEEWMTEDYLNSHYPEKMRDAMLVQFRNEYNALSKAYKNAPEKSNSDVRATVKFYPSNHYIDPEVLKEEIAEAKRFGAQDTVDILESKEETEFRCVAKLENGFYGGIYASNFDNKGYKTSSILFTRSKVLDEDNHMMPKSVFSENTSVCTLSEAEAIKQADSLVKELGMSDEFGLSETEKRKGIGKDDWYAYYVTYRRRCNKLIMNELPADISKEGAEFRPIYGEEILRVIINDDGIAEWYYSNPHQILRTVNEGVEVLSFDEVLEIYKKQSAIQYDNVMSYNEASGHLDEIETAPLAAMKVDTIKLSLMRVAQKNKTLTYLLVPVWEFSGKRYFYNKDESPIEGIVTDENGQIIMGETNSTDFYIAEKMLINAIDGSIISTEDCY